MCACDQSSIFSISVCLALVSMSLTLRYSFSDWVQVSTLATCIRCQGYHQTCFILAGNFAPTMGFYWSYTLEEIPGSPHLYNFVHIPVCVGKHGNEAKSNVYALHCSVSTHLPNTHTLTYTCGSPR